MPHTELPLFFPRRTTSDGSTNVFLKTDRVPRGEVWVITKVVFEDETTAFTSARIFRGTEQRPYWLSEQLNPSAGVLYWDNEDYMIGEGEELGVRFTGTTSGDILTASFSGRRLVNSPGPGQGGEGET